MHWIMNTSLIKKLIILLIAFFTPIVTAMIACGLLITIDTIFGVINAKKNNISITSRKFSMILTKLLVYNLLIISAHLVELYLFASIPMVKITIAFLGITEFYSIGEKFNLITGKNFIKYLKDTLNNITKRV